MNERNEASESGIERQLSEQGVYVSTTVGWSMFPMLRNRRDRIIILPIGEEDLKKYDLPLYRRPDGKYVLHRILSVKKDHYVIRGDNTFKKEYVPKEWVLGYVSEFYRQDRHVRSDARGYRLYARLWRWIYPVRWCLYFARRCIGKLKRMLFSKKEDKK